MIYILRQDDYFDKNSKSYIKVGFTKRNIEKRIRELQAGNPRPLNLYLNCSGSRREEEFLKHRLRNHKAPGGSEWFFLNQETENLLKLWVKNKEQNAPCF